jgi:hypothetical protein
MEGIIPAVVRRIWYLENADAIHSAVARRMGAELRTAQNAIAHLVFHDEDRLPDVRTLSPRYELEFFIVACHVTEEAMDREMAALLAPHIDTATTTTTTNHDGRSARGQPPPSTPRRNQLRRATARRARRGARL